MKTFEQLVEALIFEANTDGVSGALDFSDALVSNRNELLARAARLAGTDRPLDGDQIRAVLDGQA